VCAPAGERGARGGQRAEQARRRPLLPDPSGGGRWPAAGWSPPPLLFSSPPGIPSDGGTDRVEGVGASAGRLAGAQRLNRGGGPASPPSTDAGGQGAPRRRRVLLMRAAPSRSSFGLPCMRASDVGGGMVAARCRPVATHAPVGAVPTALTFFFFKLLMAARPPRPRTSLMRV
jgi:hypothetical protein